MTGDRGGLDLRDWDAVLLEACRPAEPSQRFYLYVDRDVLAEILRQDPAEALEAFVAEFRRRCGVRPFARALSAARTWRTGGFDGPPPFVSALAMTVLAVTEEPVGSHGVYPRQNELLGLAPVPEAPPGYGDDVPCLWTIWNEWLADKGRPYGRSSARTHDHWTLQGWARSQAIIRHRDRLLMEDFFLDTAVPIGGGDLTGGSLLLRFAEWLRFRGANGSALLERVPDEPSREVLGDVLGEEAARWTGVPRPRRGSTTVRGLLVFDDWTEGFSVGVPVDDRLRGVSFRVGEQEYVPEASDRIVTLPLAVEAASLLEHGVVHEVSPGLRVRAGGESLYVLQDDPEEGALVQTRALVRSRQCVVLGRQERLAAAAKSLGREAPRASVVPGWAQMHVPGDDAGQALLDALGLSGLLPATVPEVRLVGGLRVRRGSYLSGYEPDLLMRADVDDVCLDGRPLGLPLLVASGAAVVPLRELYLDPGEHSAGPRGEEIGVEVVTHMRERCAGGGIGWLRDASEAGRHPLEDCDVSGSLTPTRPASAALVVRVLPGQELLALCEDGRLLQIHPTPPAWIVRAGLQAQALDVLAAFRTLPSRPAFALVRSPRTGRVQALEVPADVLPVPGMASVDDRPDLVPHVINDWHWLSPPNARRRSELLNRALVPRPSARQQRTSARPPALVARRQDIVEGSLAENPYDDVLMWLSELEGSRCSAADFRDAWSWSCERYGLIGLAEGWRLAALELAGHGHIERDYRRQQIAIAPAALVDLPSASGLGLLTGARPVRLLDRMADDQDVVSAVADGAASWSIQARTQVDSAGLPMGPTAVYVDWERAERDAVDAALRELGVTLTGLAGPALLRTLRPVAHELATGLVLTTSPAQDSWLRERVGHMRYRWVPKHTDAAAGLYRYRLPHGDVFAHRRVLDEPLKRVPRHAGLWLDTERQEPHEAVVHHVLRHSLIVPVNLPLPPLLHRALVLRTGLPPWTTRGFRPDRRGPGHDYRVYDNVDIATAEQVTDLLGQPCVHVQDDLEEG